MGAGVLLEPATTPGPHIIGASRGTSLTRPYPLYCCPIVRNTSSEYVRCTTAVSGTCVHVKSANAVGTDRHTITRLNRIATPFIKYSTPCNVATPIRPFQS